MDEDAFSNVSGEDEPMRTPPTTARRRKDELPRSPIATRASTRALRPPYTDTEDNGESGSRGRIQRSSIATAPTRETTVTSQETDEDRDATEAEGTGIEPRTPATIRRPQTQRRQSSVRSRDTDLSAEEMRQIPARNA